MKKRRIVLVVASALIKTGRKYFIIYTTLLRIVEPFGSQNSVSSSVRFIPTEAMLLMSFVFFFTFSCVVCRDYCQDDGDCIPGNISYA